MGLVSGPCIAMIILGFAVRVSEPPVWWVDMFFFLGFLLSFLMDKLLDTD